MTEPTPQKPNQTTFSVLLGHGARNLDAFRPTGAAGMRSERSARSLLERHKKLLDLADLTAVGENALGWVFRARQESLGRAVEVRVGASPTFAPDAAGLRRQAAKMSRLEAGVPRVYGCGELPHDGTSYALLEWIEGPTLADVLRTGPGALAAVADPNSAAGRATWWRWLAEQLCSVATTIAHAHRIGVAHGDLHPRCIRLPPGERGPVVHDWAPDDTTRHRFHPATAPAWDDAFDYRLPLPAADSSATTPAMDAHAIAAMLYHGCTGSSPLAHHGDAARRLAALRSAPAIPLIRDPAQVTPDLPVELVSLLRSSLAQDPLAATSAGGRTAATMAAGLQAFLSSLPALGATT